MDLREVRLGEEGIQEAPSEVPSEEGLVLPHDSGVGGPSDVATNHVWEEVGPPQPDPSRYPYRKQQWTCRECGVFVMLPESHPPNKITLPERIYDCGETLAAILLEEVE